MILLTFDDEAPRRISMVPSMVTAETAAQNTFAPIDLLAVDLVGQLGVETVVGRA